MNRRTIFVTGASRGVGLEICKKFAKENANIAFVAKTTEVNPKLPGTIHTASKELKELGANDVLSIQCDVRNLESLQMAINEVGEKFGKIDILVNNASSIYLLPTKDLPEKRYDLMQEIIVRASLFSAKYALPYLRKSDNPHILSIVPKIDLNPKWFTNHVAYTICKFAGSMLVIGLASEFANMNIAVNGLWPRTLLKTAAVRNLLGGDMAISKSRDPEIMADAAFIILNKPSSYTGHFHLDEDVLLENGLDITKYAQISSKELITDLYV